MSQLKLIAQALDEVLAEHEQDSVFTFDDRVLEALAKDSVIRWCGENSSSVRPELLTAIASVYREVAYRGGPGALPKARGAFLKVVPGNEAAFDDAKPIDFQVRHLVERGLPDSFAPTDREASASVFQKAVRKALGESFPDACRPSLGTAVNLLRAVPDLMEGRLGFNEMTGEIVVGQEELADLHVLKFRENAERRFRSNKGDPLRLGNDLAWDAVRTVAPDQKFHPVRDYLKSLKWDGKPRLDDAARDLLNSRTDHPIVGKIVRKWFIACVARIFQPGCKVDTMLVLVSSQGALKSSFFKHIAGEKFFTDTAIDFEEPDSIMLMRRYWIAEHSEMKAILGSKSEEEVKAGITRTSDDFRPPYGRATIRVPRHTVFGGTTNNFDFLRDPTGSRRFWPVAVEGRIDIAKIDAVRDQIWAEAVLAYESREDWWLDVEDEPALAEYQTEFTKVDVWEDRVAAYIARQPDFVTISDILAACLSISVEKQDSKTEARVKAILLRLGWKHSRPRLPDGTRPSRYVRHTGASSTADSRRLPPAANEAMVGGGT